jgi:hypothetical protein
LPFLSRKSSPVAGAKHRPLPTPSAIPRPMLSNARPYNTRRATPNSSPKAMRRPVSLSLFPLSC